MTPSDSRLMTLEWLALLVIGIAFGVLGHGAMALDFGAWASIVAGAAALLGVVAVLRQIDANREDAASKSYLDAAIRRLSVSLDEFVAVRDPHGRPVNDRLNWLNLARGIETARRFANLISRPEDKEIWRTEEHSMRLWLSDVLTPNGDLNGFPPRILWVRNRRRDASEPCLQSRRSSPTSRGLSGNSLRMGEVARELSRPTFRSQIYGCRNRSNALFWTAGIGNFSAAMARLVRA